MRFGPPMMYCQGVVSARECVDTQQRLDLVAGRVIEVDTGDEKDENNSRDLDHRELASAIGRDPISSPTDTDNEEDEDSNHDLDYMELASAEETKFGKVIEAETSMTRKTNIAATISTVGNLVIEAETPTTRKIYRNNKLSELQGSREQMLRAGENGECDN
ncbi:hypothetical protein ACLOJK_009423 [Asimina triloba]